MIAVRIRTLRPRRLPDAAGAIAGRAELWRWLLWLGELQAVRGSNGAARASAALAHRHAASMCTARGRSGRSHVGRR
jgi:hypothetical protein